MGINQFTEPDIDLFFDDLDQAARLNNKASFVGKGYINISIDGINTYTAPSLSPGSMFEMDGVLFSADSLTGVSGARIDNAVNCICFNGTDLIYVNANDVSWNAVKGGWYNGNSRALAKFFYSPSGPIFGNKVILDSYNAMGMANKNYTPPGSGGYQAAAGGINVETSVTLPAGTYRYEVMAGTGGNGGRSGFNQPGGIGALGEVKRGTLFLEAKNTVIYLSAGGNGANGADGSAADGGSGGGGGGCTGGSSYLYVPAQDLLVIAVGGSGGGGSSDNMPGDTHGGGGSGGGYGYNGGGGGSGFISGGSGGNGGTGSGTSGSSGGGYGEKGGDANYGGGFGNGGASKKLGTGLRDDSSLYGGGRRLENAYQGGGSGGSGYHSWGGSGGGVLMDYTSAYARVFRMG